MKPHSDAAMLGAPKYDRIEDEKYFTPTWCTELLLRHVNFDFVWEPAAGDGAIVRVIRAARIPCAMSDKTPSAPQIAARDFFETTMPDPCKDIVTNPPYNIADAFIARALSLTEPRRGKVAMLLRNEFDSADKRNVLFKDNPAFALKITLTKRPRWFEGPGSVSPRHNFAWFVWDWASTETPPKIIWDK